MRLSRVFCIFKVFVFEVVAIDVGEQPSLLQKNPQAASQRKEKSGITKLSELSETWNAGRMAGEFFS
jgi:hypothetical protein